MTFLRKLVGFVTSTVALTIVVNHLPAFAQNRIVESTGTVFLRRGGSPSFRPVPVGTQLYRGDILKPASGARVTVLCSNLRRWVVPAGIPSNLNSGCPNTSSSTQIGLRGGPVLNVPGGDNPEIPYIITPRRTWLLSQSPILRWNAVPGAKTYMVKVIGPGVNWETQVAETEVVYPNNPPLKPEETYLVIVTADNGKSSLEESITWTQEAPLLPLYQDSTRKGWGFSVRYPDEALDSLEADIASVKGDSLPEDAKVLALADLYVKWDLNAEAIDLLEERIARGSTTIAIYRLLGDLYSRSGLNLLAEARYLKVAELADANDNPEALASAHAGLARVYTVMGRRQAADQQFKNAQTTYRSIGDREAVEELENSLIRLAEKLNESKQYSNESRQSSNTLTPSLTP